MHASYSLEHLRAGEGMVESVEMVMPPAGSSLGSSKLLIVTPGRPLNALSVTFFVSWTPSKMVPKAVTRRLFVEITQVNSSLCSKYVANVVNASSLVIVKWPLVT